MISKIVYNLNKINVMRKQTLPLLLALSGIFSTVSAQVGVNTTTPAATLDVTAKNATGSTTNVDGLLLPRVDRQRAQVMSGVPTSTLIFVNSIATGTQTGTAVNIDATGYYFFSGGVWVKLMTPAAASVNIYNADGTLTGNRIVTQAANTLAFTGTATNAFSVDGTTLSVDAAGDKVGVGSIAPNEKLDVAGAVAFNGKAAVDKTSAGTIDYFTGQSRVLSWGPDASTNGILSFWTGLGGGATAEKMRIHSNGYVGIGNTSPAANLDIAAVTPIGTATSVEGLLIPRVNRQRAQSMTGVPTSTLIYVMGVVAGSQTGTAINMDTVGYYYFNGSVWVKLKSTDTPDVNLYSSDGTLAGNRVVTQGTNTLAFTSNAVNGFSVDGTTFSVDGLNNRLGIGTSAPTNSLTIVDPTNANQFQGTASILANNLSQGVGIGWEGIQSIGTNANADLSLNAKGTGNVVLQTQSTGNIGVGTSTPQNKLHVNGNLQITNELNVGGNATTAGSAGTTGQILTSAGAGVAPTWQTPAANVNIYNADGSLTGNRIVTQAANTLAFTGTATNAFSVDGTTLSVDAANDRIGIGTAAPGVKLDVAQAIGVSEATQLRIINTSPVATNNTAYIGFNSYNGGGATWGMGSLQNSAGITDSNFHILYSSGGTYGKFFTIRPNTGNTGIGTVTPQKRLHVLGDFQVTGEVNVGGNATTAGSAGTTGQILTSAGVGAAPTWQTPAASVNIYNADGSLTGNRIVTQGTNTLAFTGSAVNAFSVAGSTFSVDAANNRVGIGTAAPNAQLELGPTVANRKIVLYGSFNNDNQFYGFGVNSGVMRYQADVTATDHVFYAGTSATTSNELMRIKGTGNVGIGTSTPTNNLDVNGTTRVRTMSVATPGTILSPVYADPNGVLVKSSVSSTYGNFSSNSSSISSGSTGALVTGLAEGVYRVTVVVINACNDVSTADFYVHNFSLNNFYGLNGQDGFTTSGAGGNNHPAFTQSVRTSIGVSWTGVVTCAGGGDSTGFNYTLTIPSAGTINVTNNGNAARSYRATFTRID